MRTVAYHSSSLPWSGSCPSIARPPHFEWCRYHKKLTSRSLDTVSINLKERCFRFIVLLYLRRMYSLVMFSCVYGTKNARLVDTSQSNKSQDKALENHCLLYKSQWRTIEIYTRNLAKDYLCKTFSFTVLFSNGQREIYSTMVSIDVTSVAITFMEATYSQFSLTGIDNSSKIYCRIQSTTVDTPIPMLSFHSHNFLGRCKVISRCKYNKRGVLEMVLAI